MGVKNNAFMNKYIKYSPRKIRQSVDKDQDNKDQIRSENTVKRRKKTHPALKTQKKSKLYEDHHLALKDRKGNLSSQPERTLESDRCSSRSKARISKQILELRKRGSNAFEIARLLHLPRHIVQRHLRRSGYSAQHSVDRNQ